MGGPASQSLLGISVDEVWCHTAFVEHQHYFPLLADFKPKGAVAKQCSAYRTGKGLDSKDAGGRALEHVVLIIASLS
jgi:peroxiredoxin